MYAGSMMVSWSFAKSLVYTIYRHNILDEYIRQNSSSEACDLLLDDFTSTGQILAPRDSRKSVS